MSLFFKNAKPDGMYGRVIRPGTLEIPQISIFFVINAILCKQHEGVLASLMI